MDWIKVSGRWKQLSGKILERGENPAGEDASRAADEREQSMGATREHDEIADNEVKKPVER